MDQLCPRPCIKVIPPWTGRNSKRGRKHKEDGPDTHKHKGSKGRPIPMIKRRAVRDKVTSLLNPAVQRVSPQQKPQSQSTRRASGRMLCLCSPPDGSTGANSFCSPSDSLSLAPLPCAPGAGGSCSGQDSPASPYRLGYSIPTNHTIDLMLNLNEQRRQPSHKTCLCFIKSQKFDMLITSMNM